MYPYFKKEGRSDIICSIFPGKPVAEFSAEEDLKEFSKFLLLQLLCCLELLAAETLPLFFPITSNDKQSWVKDQMLDPTW